MSYRPAAPLTAAQRLAALEARVAALEQAAEIVPPLPDWTRCGMCGRQPPLHPPLPYRCPCGWPDALTIEVHEPVNPADGTKYWMGPIDADPDY